MADIDSNITIVDEEGNEVLCDVLFTFQSDDFNKHYVLYYPTSEEDEEGNVELFASSYDPDDDGEGQLYPVESEEEWDMIEEMVNTFLEEDEE